MISADNMVWVDMEFSGLDPEKDVVLEIATIVTDKELNVLEEGPVLAIHHPDEVLEWMDEWNTSHHTESGLVDRVRASKESHESAEAKTMDFVRKFCVEGENPLCGNSIHMDRYFMKIHMPKLEAFFNYRNVDVTSVKELVKRWYPNLPFFEKELNHTALSDIKESIEELKYYREKIFVEK